MSLVVDVKQTWKALVEGPVQIFGVGDGELDCCYHITQYF